MARTTITPVTPIGPYPVLPVAANSADLTLTAADVTNGNAIPFAGVARMLVLVQNSDASTAYTVTFDSARDGLNREGDIGPYSLSAGEVAAFVFSREGWRQSDNMLYVNGQNAAIKIAAIRL